MEKDLLTDETTATSIDVSKKAPIETQFNLQNVGQGTFFSGNIGTYNFIYDCGSTSKRDSLYKSIDKYCHELNLHFKKTISLLVVSHYHQDHINGIFELLRNSNLEKIEKIILPYYTPIERLFQLLTNDEFIASRNTENKNRDEVNQNEYIQFITDPAQFLLKLEGKIGEIVFVRNNNNDFFDNREEYQGLKDDGELLNFFRQNESNSEEFIDAKISFKYTGAFQSNAFETIEGKEKDTPIIHRLYNQKIDENTIVDFSKEVDKKLNELNIGPISFQNTEFIKSLKELKLTSKEENESSLILLIQAKLTNAKEMRMLNIMDIEENEHRYLNTTTCRYFKPDVQKINVLLFGDNTLKKLGGDFKKQILHSYHYFHSLCSECDPNQNALIVLIPHHGSQASNSFCHFHPFDHHCCSKNMITLVSAGAKNTYGHPYPPLFGIYHKLLWSSEFNKITIHINKTKS